MLLSVVDWDRSIVARRLPPFAAIRAFEVVARSGNLRVAAQELHLSVSALSHQLKSLENYVGIPLFLRNHSGLRLTESGNQYAQELTRALDSISLATAKVEAGPRRVLSIWLSPSMAGLWLLPRLGKFNRLVPSVDIRMVTSLAPHSSDAEMVDFRIGYGGGAPPGAIRLFDEAVFPVCAPDQVDKYAFEAADPDNDLSKGTLIVCQTMPEEWNGWFRFSEFRGRRPERLISVDNRALALEAATEGLGVAMGRTPFVNDAIGAGKLRRASSKTFADGCCYYLVTSSLLLQDKVAENFSDWLVTEAAGTAGTRPPLSALNLRIAG